MRNLFLNVWLVAALSLLFSTSNVIAQENILVNPGFEKGPEGWTEWDSVEGVTGGEVSSEEFHGGAYSGKRWLTNPEELVYSVFIQELTIEAQKGDVITFSGWMMSPARDPLKNGAEAFLVIEFWKGTEKIGFPETERLRGQSQWKQYKVSGTAPEGTSTVKVCCFLFGPAGAKGTVYFDDLKIEVKSKGTAKDTAKDTGEVQEGGKLIKKSIYKDK